MRVSAIISAYYAEKYLKSRIDNLRGLTVPTEVIVVCKAFSEEHRIAVAMNADEIVTTLDIPTVYKAWNLGIEEATCEYVTNANSDDILYPDALEHLIGLLDASPEFCLAYANCDIVAEYGGDVVSRYEWAEGELDELLKHCFIGPMPVWRRSLHKMYGFFDEEMQSAGDYDFWLRLASSGEKFIHSKRSVGAFLYHEDSASLRTPLISTWETARARARVRKKLPKEN